MLACDARKRRFCLRNSVREASRIVGFVQRRTNIVAHSAIDADVFAHSFAVDQHIFDRAHGVERRGRRADDRPTRLNRDDRNRDLKASALGLDDVCQRSRQFSYRQRLISRRVGNAETSTQVQLRHRRVH